MRIHGNLKVWTKDFRRRCYVGTNFSVGSSEGVLLGVGNYRNYLAKCKNMHFFRIDITMHVSISPVKRLFLLTKTKTHQF